VRKLGRLIPRNNKSVLMQIWLLKANHKYLDEWVAGVWGREEIVDKEIEARKSIFELK
jgi:hypothetical protein